MGTKSTPLIVREMEVGWVERDQRTNDDTIRGHILAGNLQPTSWRGAQVDTASCRSQEVVFFVQLYQLERRTGSVALFPGWRVEKATRGTRVVNALCKLVVFVYPALSSLFLRLTHGWRSD